MRRIAIVEDQDRFREALQTVFEATDDLSVAAAFRTVEALEAWVRTRRDAVETWDLVLMDLELPGRSGIDGLRTLKAARPGLPVVVCTVFEESGTVQAAIQAGADGYLVKRTPLPELLRQIRQACAGGAPVAAEVAASLLQLVRTGAPTPVTAEVWKIRVDGSEIEGPQGRLDLRRRRAVRLLLAALARHRLEHPGEALSTQACIEAGWPGERMLHEAASARLWSAIRALRDLGLEDVLQTVGEGYRLAPTNAVRILPR